MAACCSCNGPENAGNAGQRTIFANIRNNCSLTRISEKRDLPALLQGAPPKQRPPGFNQMALI